MQGMKPLDPEEKSWDKKKIIIAIVILSAVIGIGYKAKVLVLGKNGSSTAVTISAKSSDSVAGAQTDSEDEASSDTQNTTSPFSFSPETIQTTAQEKLNSIKQQVADLNIQDIASSSPQVQKVINDLKSLEQYPKDQAKQMCENICKGL